MESREQNSKNGSLEVVDAIAESIVMPTSFATDNKAFGNTKMKLLRLSNIIVLAYKTAFHLKH